jgi:isopentenyldiphosphate isomerase
VPKITVVDEEDTVIGAAERSEVRANGWRHRIVRVFIRNNDGKLLLQQRSQHVHDSPGKWDQSVGGHVDEGEDYLTAAQRETQEELGIAAIDLQEIGKFAVDRPAVDGFIRRFQTVYIGTWNGDVQYEPSEVASIRWLTPAEIDTWLAERPEDFTYSFGRAFRLVQQALADTATARG